MKISNKRLLIILVVLAVVYSLTEYFSGPERSKSFRQELVEIDTSEVTRINIMSPNDTVDLSASGSSWIITLSSGRKVKADPDKVKSTFSTLLTIEPNRIVARKEEKWKEFQVDSAGTRVQVYEGDDKTLDLIIGRFGMKGQRQFYTYTRLHDENEVYAVDNFMGFSISGDPKTFRKNQVIRVTKDSIRQITFNYPDSSFSLRKENNRWMMQEIESDSANMAQYLNKIRSLTDTNFIDDTVGIQTSEIVSLQIEVQGEEDIEVKGFKNTSDQWVIHSSQNPDEYFSDPELFDKIFKGQSYFLSD